MQILERMRARLAGESSDTIDHRFAANVTFWLAHCTSHVF